MSRYLLLWVPGESHRLRMARTMLAYAVLPNALFWIASIFFPILPRFNLDFLLIALLACFCSRAVTTVLLAFTVLAEMVTSWLYIYSLTANDLYTVFHYLVDVPWQRVAVAAILLLIASFAVAVATVAAAGTVWRAADRRRSILCMAALLLVGCGFQIMDSQVLWNRDSRSVHTLMMTSYGHLLRAGVIYYFPGMQVHYSGAKVASATGDYFAAHPLQPASVSHPHNIVLVIVESYGVMADPALGAKLDVPYWDPELLKKYTVGFSTVPTLGGTVSAEFRELCGLQLPLAALLDAPKFMSTCLPAKLAQSGYSVEGLHGYSGHMFGRAHWWQELGIEHREFYEEIRPEPNIHECTGPFPGICDSDMASIIRRMLLKNEPSQPLFIYWVTLNSHLPITISKNSSTQFQCGTVEAPIADSGICNWMGLIYKVNKAMADLAADPKLPPTDFIIVGDHPPPFFSLSRRAQFVVNSAKSVVLVRKDEATR